MGVKKKKKTMDELTKGYEQFIKGKKLNKNGKDDFEKVLAATVKGK